MRLLSLLGLVLLLAACGAPNGRLGPDFDAETAARNFVTVVQRVEPVAEQACRSRTKRNCDFQIVVDEDPRRPPNAFQTEQPDGRPVIIFTLSLIADARNPDELAFILGHEAAHHIRGHLKQTQRNAKLGAETLGKAVRAAGGSKEQVEVAARVGALGGLLRYSKEFELAADELGTLIALRAGYDPVLGAQFFDRLPDPGDSFLNTHPPNEERREIVRRITAANS